MSAAKHRPSQDTTWGLLVTVVLLATAGGCELVASIDDREVYPGGQGGTTSSSGGGTGGAGGQTGGSGGGVGCSPPLGAWSDSTPLCVGTGGCAKGEDGDEVTVAPSYETCPPPDVVHDVVTGLFWERAADCDGCSHGDATIHCDDLTAHRVGGFEDWRVPTLRELVSIMDFGLYQPVVPLPFSQESGFFVSNDLKENNAHWGARVGPGHLTWWSQGVAANARCVRGVGPESTFELNTDTVVDTGLSLEWTGDASSGAPLNWNGARTYCNDLSDPPGGGWRLPTAKEHMTVYIPVSTGGVFPAGFTAVPQSYWTSTADPADLAHLSRAMVVYYATSDVTDGALSAALTGDEHHALCVRAHP